VDVAETNPWIQKQFAMSQGERSQAERPDNAK
jgi:hypothetical protein